ncbi:hypothetical protein ABH935_009297 [Catenulispora sp. GAS73]|uniref:S53 family peptidase n=1 Tax=Catenulispora sp. GAS73 TaxID=3156269 RepID=UPI003513EDDC
MNIRKRSAFARNRIHILATAVAATAMVAGVTVSAEATPSGSLQGAGNVKNACGLAKPGRARCFAEIRTDVHGGKGVRGQVAGAAATLPQGLGPADLRSAYKLPAIGGRGQTVAIVDAGDDATAEADLTVYRTTYGLPACTTANGCFHKVNQRGATTPLPADQGWGVEIALDLDMVSAACPQCHILLVEGDTADFNDLGLSVNTAVSLGAKEVSNSYGATEQNGDQVIAPYYSHPGVAIVASSGDSGYGVASAPAAFPSVVAVGGTSLTKAANARGWTETAWRGAGSGCSAWFAKPAWQTDPNCPGRMVADVAADADPQTGPAIYGTTDGITGWGIVGGTSASSPYLAGVIALAGHPQRFPDASYLYSHTSGLYDVVGGANNEVLDCGGDYQCNAVAGYDGPTGLGTPHGLGAF